MLRRTSGLLSVVLLWGVGQAGVFLWADEPVKTGQQRETLLYVRTDPPGAKVILNGKELGVSNDLFRVEPGTGTILVELEGRKPDTRPVIIRANGVTRVELQLKPEAELHAKANAKGAHVAGHLPPGAVKPVSITIGPKSFRDGDSIIIHEVKASSPDLKSGDKVIVKGHYTLASEPKASLCLFATAKTGPGKSRIQPQQRITITQGQGDFELSETMAGDGYLHVSFYSVATGKGNGGLYFGTAKQMEEIKDWDVGSWNTPKPRVESKRKPQAEAATEGARFIGRLPQGTVELVGITKYPPTEQSQWWKPDGSPAHLGPFRHEPTNWSTPTQKTRAFLLRIQDLPGGASRPAIAVEPCTGGWWGTTGVLGVDEERVPNCSMFSAEVGDSAVTASLRVGVSMGAWMPPFHGVEFRNVALELGQKTAVKVISSDDARVIAPSDWFGRSSLSDSMSQDNKKAPQRKASAVRKVDFVIGPSSFAKGDKIVIEEVRSELGTLANGDVVTVKGTYTLASHDAATLGFYITEDASKATRGGLEPYGLTRPAKAGTARFEWQRFITCDGHLHLSFYDNQSRHSFGTVYFGTGPQMKEISHWKLDGSK